MFLTSCVLVFRSILDVWTIYLGTLLESAIITMDSKRFNHHLVHFAMLMPSVSLRFFPDHFVCIDLCLTIPVFWSAFSRSTRVLKDDDHYLNLDFCRWRSQTHF